MEHQGLFDCGVPQAGIPVPGVPAMKYHGNAIRATIGKRQSNTAIMRKQY
jgi:hypothetical protein